MSVFRAVVRLDPGQCLVNTMAAHTDPPHREVLEGLQIFRLPDDYPKCLGHPVGVAGISSGKEVLEWYLGFVTHIKNSRIPC